LNTNLFEIEAQKHFLFIDQDVGWLNESHCRKKNWIVFVD